VTLKPGQTIAWERVDGLTVDHRYPTMLDGLHFRFTYRFAGSQFGLRAWRGALTSNHLNGKVVAE
jgi:hypothetical protein